MQDVIKGRRLQAMAYRVAERLGLTDPRFNLREIAKQLVLLEDHLAHPYKACPDCIRKHLLTIEAYAEEAVALDEEQSLAPGMTGLAELARQWQERLADGEDLATLGQAIRQVRKSLSQLACDPRERSSSRVASRYQMSCPHQG